MKLPTKQTLLASTAMFIAVGVLCGIRCTGWLGTARLRQRDSGAEWGKISPLLCRWA
jgi:hypothetical protein